MKTFADAEARLAEALPGYESRPQQQTMACQIEDAIATRMHLLVEAGCGTGKSFGYLIPSILSGQRSVISTATKALQDQIAGKDLPFLAEKLGHDFTYAILKGRANYICGAKLRAATSDEVTRLADLLEVIDRPDFSGERADLPFDVSDRDWARVHADSDACQVFECSKQAKKAMDPADVDCFAERARARAREAQVVIVNHMLYMNDLKLREASDGFATMIGMHDVVVFDEGHEVEEWATKALGTEFKDSGLRNLCSEVTNYVHKFAPDFESEVAGATGRILVATQALWSVLTPGRIRWETIKEHTEAWVELADALGALVPLTASPAMLDGVPTKDLEAARKRRDILVSRVNGRVTAFHALLRTPFADMVRWVEEETFKAEKRLVIKTAPITVSEYLRGTLFDPPEARTCGRCGGMGTRGERTCGTCRGSGQVPVTPITAILTSATLSVNGEMDYIANRLGIDHFNSLDVGTPFDFPKQALLYVPAKMVPPDKKHMDEWSTAMIAHVTELVKASDGRALLLFTSNKQMRNAHGAIADRLPYTVLMQGQGNNRDLARQFIEDEHSVLFATRSFMTGFDAQGSTLSLVVIDKMPFPVPTEPLFEARKDAIEAANGNSFAELSVPAMILVLKQAFGRLIRHRDDKGVVAILDSRITNQWYGKKTVQPALPDAKLVTTIAEVQDFFGEEN